MHLVWVVELGDLAKNFHQCVNMLPVFLLLFMDAKGER